MSFHARVPAALTAAPGGCQAAQLAPPGKHPAGTRVSPMIPYTEGPLTVAGFPADENESLIQRKCYPHQVGGIVGLMLDRGCRYVLVEDLNDRGD